MYRKIYILQFIMWHGGDGSCQPAQNNMDETRWQRHEELNRDRRANFQAGVWHPPELLHRRSMRNEKFRRKQNPALRRIRWNRKFIFRLLVSVISSWDLGFSYKYETLATVLKYLARQAGSDFCMFIVYDASQFLPGYYGNKVVKHLIRESLTSLISKLGIM